MAKTGVYRQTLEVDEEELQTFEIPYYYTTIEGEIYLVFDEVFRNSVTTYIPTQEEVDMVRGKIMSLLKLGGAV